MHTSLFEEKAIQRILQHGRAHGADVVEVLQHWVRDGSAGNAVPVQEPQDHGGMKAQTLFRFRKDINKPWKETLFPQAPQWKKDIKL